VRIVGYPVKAFVAGFVADERAQDLVEYAFLGAFIGIVSILVWQNIATAIGLSYTEYNTNVNTLWASPEPP